jgi:lysophospholipid acyltransferase (LPLAT)-like uncharacterized protein
MAVGDDRVSGQDAAPDVTASARRPPPAALIAMAAVVLHGLGRSWRVRRVGTAVMDARMAAGERVIYSVWHSRLLPFVYTHRGSGVTGLISRSRDGDLIAALAERMGFRSARGSSSRGGLEGFLEMVRHGKRGRSLALMPDGPRGPAGVAKSGIARLGCVTGLPVLPIASAARPAWYARSWDRFLVPPPFATVWIGYGEPISVPPDLDDAGIEEWTRRIEAAVHAITDRLTALAGEEPVARRGAGAATGADGEERP